MCNVVYVHVVARFVSYALIDCIFTVVNFYCTNYWLFLLGEVARASNWERGLRNLSAYQTNRLKVTRILKCLGEFGLDHFQLHLVKHLLREMFVQETVKDCLESCLHYWIEVIRNDTQRDELYRLAVNLDLFK